jgi:hypothetical protein
MDTVWLSYDALAARLKITPASARRLAARNKHWARRIANDGRALVAVPAERLPPDIGPDAGDDDTPAAAPDAGADVGDDARDDIARLVRVFAQQVERLEKDLDVAKAERDAERACAANLALQVAQVDALRAVLEAERRQADALRAERDQALECISRHVADLARAEHDRDRAAEALAVHLALPWWRRLFG